MAHIRSYGHFLNFMSRGQNEELAIYLGSGAKYCKNKTTFSNFKSLREESTLILMFSRSYPELWPFSQFYVQGTNEELAISRHRGQIFWKLYHFAFSNLSLRKESALILIFSGSYLEIWPFSQFYVQGTKWRIGHISAQGPNLKKIRPLSFLEVKKFE